MNRLKELSSFLTGMVAGTIGGSLVAMWLSPNSGEKNREELQKIIITIQDQATSRVQDVVGQVQNRLPIPNQSHDDNDNLPTD